MPPQMLIAIFIMSFMMLSSLCAVVFSYVNLVLQKHPSNCGNIITAVPNKHVYHEIKPLVVYCTGLQVARTTSCLSLTVTSVAAGL